MSPLDWHLNFGKAKSERLDCGGTKADLLALRLV